MEWHAAVRPLFPQGLDGRLEFYLIPETGFVDVSNFRAGERECFAPVVEEAPHEVLMFGFDFLDKRFDLAGLDVRWQDHGVFFSEKDVKQEVPPLKMTF